ncbi:MAG: hypothetical protein WCC64_07645 [Aliidongia sp.]
MRALVAATIFMGILIIIGVAVIIGTILHRVSAPKPGVATAVATPGHAALALPPGARIAGMTSVGERLVLHVTDADNRESLITLDPVTGAVLETIDLVSQPPAVRP